MRDYGKYIVILAAVLAAVLLYGRAASAQTGGVTVISVAGKAEILEQGRRTPAREGHRLLPGQSVRLVGGGEVRLSTTDGRIQVRVLDNTTLKYDGPAGANSLPWTPASQYQRASSAEERKVPQMSVPVGRLEVEVQPGQELRLVMPLIMAAVRGTRFTVSVDLDGTSRVSTFDGAVAAYGRNGEFRLTLAGQTAEVTARAYAGFLAAQGVIAPGGNWKNVPPRTQERVDNSVIGPVFGEGGGDLLASVLANPNASPTSGVSALAVETAAAGTGSLFAESSEGSSFGGGGSSGLASQSGGGGILPDSTLFDQGMPEMDIDIPHSSTHSGPIAHFIGDFALSASPSDIYFNDLFFELDLGNGRISKAGFYVNYLGPPNVSYIMGAEHAIYGDSGSGYLNANTLYFDISGFNTEFVEDFDNSASATGTLGSQTRLVGSFMGPLDFGDIATGQLTIPQYDVSSGTIADMPAYLNFSGDLNHNPLVYVNGSFDLSAYPYVDRNEFEFFLDLNTGAITEGQIDVIYRYANTDEVDLLLRHGSGSISSGNFFGMSASGNADLVPNVGPSVMTTASGFLSGSFDRTPETGATVVPGGTMSISYGPGSLPGYEPSYLTVAGGTVTQSGQ